jgi:hypothetical protein
MRFSNSTEKSIIDTITMNNSSRIPERVYTWKDFLFAPLGCLISIPAPLVFGSLIVVFLAGLLFYYNVNAEIFGIGQPPYDRMQIDRTWEHIRLDEQTWSLEYEDSSPRSFQGVVRYIGPIRQAGIPFLTHDVLVTSGDFANPALVRTSVFNHTFSWYSRKLQNPQGAINLVHAVPQKKEIYQQLLALTTDQRVRITGFEVLRINAFNAKGSRYVWWQDAGCNTLLITRIELINP